MGAAAIVSATGIGVGQLSQRMINVQVVGTMGGVPQHRVVGTMELVGPDNRL